MTQTNLDLTDKHPTALIRLEAVVRGMKISKSFNDDYKRGYNSAIEHVLRDIHLMKPSELADLMQSFCEGGIETESAETWIKKWGQTEPNQP
jgi:hypothetical protein